MAQATTEPVRLPPGPRTPRTVQGLRFLVSRRSSIGGLTRRYGPAVSLNLPIFGKTVLIVGFGRIGTRTAKRCLAMEMNVLIYDPYKSAIDIKAAGCEPVADLDAALPRADFVSIHCPKNPETVGMFSAARIKLMKPTAYLINTARGEVVDEDALINALTHGGIANNSNLHCGNF